MLTPCLLTRDLQGAWNLSPLGPQGQLAVCFSRVLPPSFLLPPIPSLFRTGVLAEPRSEMLSLSPEHPHHLSYLASLPACVLPSSPTLSPGVPV